MRNLANHRMQCLYSKANLSLQAIHPVIALPESERHGVSRIFEKAELLQLQLQNNT